MMDNPVLCPRCGGVTTWVAEGTPRGVYVHMDEVSTRRHARCFDGPPRGGGEDLPVVVAA